MPHTHNLWQLQLSGIPAPFVLARLIRTTSRRTVLVQAAGTSRAMTERGSAREHGNCPSVSPTVDQVV